MVCHAMPPPIASFDILAYVDENIRNDLNFQSRHGLQVEPYHGPHRDHFAKMGFTHQKSLVTIHPSDLCGFYHSRGGVDMYFDRTVEEGWVVIDHVNRRWKRLGWIDWFGTYRNDEMYWAWGSRTVMEELERLFMREDGWVWGEDGWRYDRPTTILGNKIYGILTRSMDNNATTGFDALLKYEPFAFALLLGTPF